MNDSIWFTAAGVGGGMPDFSLGGLQGMGRIPGMGGAGGASGAGGMPDMNTMMQMMQNPQVQGISADSRDPWPTSTPLPRPECLRLPPA